MITSADYFDSLRFPKFTGWLLTGLLIIIGFGLFKDVVSFVLVKLYQWFIQQSPWKG